LDAFSNEKREINEEYPKSKWKVSFTEKDADTFVETAVAYKSLTDLETVIQMGMEQGQTATLEKLDELLLVLKQGQ
jgi:hypothetical protein